MRLTCRPEPNLVGSKHSCCIDAFKHTPNHPLKLGLHLKKKEMTQLLLGLGPHFMLNITYCIKESCMTHVSAGTYQFQWGEKKDNFLFLFFL